MKALRDDTHFARFLAGLARAVHRRPSWFIIPQLALFVVSVFYTVKYLEFDTSRNNLVGSNKRYHQNFLTFKKEFPTQDDLVVVVESDDLEKNRQFIERLGVKIEAERIRIPVSPGSKETVETNLFNHIFYKGDLKMLGSKALLFLSESDLMELAQKLEDYRPFLVPFTRTTNLVSLFDMINTQFRTAKPEQNAQTDALIRTIPALERIISQATGSLLRSGVPPSPGVFALFDPDQQAQQDIYITIPGTRIYLATAQALTEDLNAAAVKRMRQLVAETRAEVPGLNVGLTGEPVLEIDEMAQSERDTALATVVSFVLVFIIIIFGYGRVSRRIKADGCLIIGMGYTMAFTTLVVGHLNILTITFAPILVGIAIDFGVHLIARYEEELRTGKSPEKAMQLAMVFTGQGIFTGAFTTAGAFAAMFLTNFKGIQEMGIICGGGLLICLVPMMTLLPALLLRGRQDVDRESEPPASEKVALRERVESIWLRRPATVIGVTVVLCALAGSQIQKITFDYNLLNMQSAGLPAVEFAEKLIYSSTNANPTATNGSGGRSVLFAAVVTDSLEQAVDCENRVRKLSTVGDVDSIAKFLTENQAEKLRLIGQIKENLASIRFAPVDEQPVDVAGLSQTLWSLNGYVGLAIDASKTEAPEVARKLESLHGAVERFRVEMFGGRTAQREARIARLTAYQRALFSDLRETFDALRTQDNRERLRIEDLPSALRDRFVGVTGKHLIQVYPRQNVWERVHQREFVEDLRKELDPKSINSPIITGTPVQLLEYTSLLKSSYEEAALYSLIAIALLVLFHFRSVWSVILTLLPVAIGSVWLAGLMGYFGVQLNPANIMTLPLVIGIGVTNGIHILNRFAEEHTPSILGKSTGKAVVVSGLTTICGFGSLVLAKHRGIESLGYVMSTGIATCMIAGLTFLPALLTLLQRRRAKKQPSADNAQSALGREEPR